MPVLLLAGGLAVGLLALLADALGAQPNEILFSGQSAIPEVIREQSTSVLLLILAAKAIAYAVSLASGFRGGPIFPAVFLGIGIATLPVVWFDVSPTLAIAVGAAAGMAAPDALRADVDAVRLPARRQRGGRRGAGGSAGHRRGLAHRVGAQPPCNVIPSPPEGRAAVPMLCSR